MQDIQFIEKHCSLRALLQPHFKPHEWYKIAWILQELFLHIRKNLRRPINHHPGGIFKHSEYTPSHYFQSHHLPKYTSWVGFNFSKEWSETYRSSTKFYLETRFKDFISGLKIKKPILIILDLKLKGPWKLYFSLHWQYENFEKKI